jgi:hypothetical protein
MAPTPVPASLATYELAGGGSYLSTHDLRLAIGLGSVSGGESIGGESIGVGSNGGGGVVGVEVTWPGGERQVFAGLGTRRYWRLRQGRAVAEAISVSDSP